MMNYYNENNHYAVGWLKNLIAEKLIPDGTVDERDIREVSASDLKGYVQCHFFAGIAGWPLALSLARWPKDRPVWTGSCPCQPFSVAGSRKGEKDERHLWPEFRRLIAERNPTTVFGEQVAGADGRRWLHGVRVDLETLGYGVGAADLCAAGVGAPHIRQRLYWVADCGGAGLSRSKEPYEGRHESGDNGRMGSPILAGLEGHAGDGADGQNRESASNESRNGRENAGFWSDSYLIPCADGKARRVESGLQCLVDGVPFRLADGRTREGTSRAALLRGLGNAIVPPLAAEFVKAYLKAVESL